MMPHGSGERDTTPNPDYHEAGASKYFYSEEDAIANHIFHRVSPRALENQHSQPHREKTITEEKAELVYPTEDKWKGDAGKSNQDALEPSIDGKWGHDMYDKICEKTIKHTLAEHWGNSYGFRKPRDGNRQRWVQNNGKVQDWRKVQNPGPTQERDERPRRKPGYCFDWLKGKCFRGSRCRYSHDINPHVGTSICFDWEKGRCTRGDACLYSHSSDNDFVEARDWRKNNVCFDFLKGGCFRETCRFAHVVNPKKENGVCYAWQSGSCERGDSCRYFHGEYYQGCSNPSQVGGKNLNDDPSTETSPETRDPGEQKKRDESWENTSWESFNTSSWNKKAESPAEANAERYDFGDANQGEDHWEEPSWEASTSSPETKRERLEPEPSNGAIEVCTSPNEEGQQDKPDQAQKPSKHKKSNEPLSGFNNKTEKLQNSITNELNVPAFKLILVGDPGTGKSSFVKRHKTGEFLEKYTATSKFEIHRLSFFTNLGKLVFDCWDISIHEKFRGLRDSCYINANAGIILFDVSSRDSFNNVLMWHHDLRRVCQNIPIVLCGNKADLQNRKVKLKDILLNRGKPNMQYYDISAKTNYNFEKPFLWIARKLCGDMNLVFKEEPVVLSTDIYISEEQKLKLQKQLVDANKINLPNDEDFDEL